MNEATLAHHAQKLFCKSHDSIPSCWPPLNELREHELTECVAGTGLSNFFTRNFEKAEPFRRRLPPNNYFVFDSLRSSREKRYVGKAKDDSLSPIRRKSTVVANNRT